MDDAQLAWLLDDAVAEVEPADRRSEIRARVRPSRQRRVYAGGALLAAAVTVAVVTLVVDGGAPDRAVDLAGSPSASSSPASAEPTTDAEDDGLPAGVFPRLHWLGDTPEGERLFSEPTFVNLGYGQELLDAAVRIVVEGNPADPDYRNGWPYSSLVSVEETDAGVVVVVDLGVDGSAPPLAYHQVARTVWGVVGRTVPVTITARTEGPARPVTIRPGDELSILALVQVEAPAQGEAVAGTFTARGLAASYEATVPWRLEDPAGRTVREGVATAEGWMDRLHPWQAEVDVNGLAPGTYTFVASTADPSGGAEGPGPTTDTRTVVVR